MRLTLILPNLGIDARIYVGATKAWLAGLDPWLVGPLAERFNAPPPTLLAMLPFALPPMEYGVVLMIGCCAGAAVLAIRRLGLRWYWLAFVPVVESVWGGNPNIIVVALVLVGASWLGAMFKIFAVVPIAFRGRRAIGGTLLALAASAPFVPWHLYLSEFATINGQYSAQGSSVGVWGTWLMIPTVLALLSLPRGEAAWLAIPTIWPVVQLHYATFMLPVANPIFALLVSSDRPGLPSIAVIVYATWRRWPQLEMLGRSSLDRLRGVRHRRQVSRNTGRANSSIGSTLGDPK